MCSYFFLKSRSLNSELCDAYDELKDAYAALDEAQTRNAQLENEVNDLTEKLRKLEIMDDPDVK